MKKFIRYVLYGLGIVALVAVLSFFFIVWRTDSRITKQYDITPVSINLMSDSSSLATGKRRAALCQTCHGEDLGGKLFFEDPKLGTIHSSNLTSGDGGIGKEYTNEDFVRAIRHGIKKSGEPVFVMPSGEFNEMTEGDMTALVSYLRTLPPVNRESTGVRISKMAKVIVAMNGFGNVIHAETIDHKAPWTKAMEPAPVAAYGEYLVNISGCRSCHGKTLNGGKDPNPHAPPGLNLTPGGSLPEWGEAGFIQTIRTGITPKGRALLTEFMPWKSLAQMNDLELKAIYAYLMAQPKLPMAEL